MNSLLPTQMTCKNYYLIFLLSSSRQIYCSNSSYLKGKCHHIPGEMLAHDVVCRI